MKISRIILTIVVGFLVVGTIIGLIVNNDLHDQTIRGAETNLIFAKNYISYVIEDETMAFNLFAIQPADSPHKITNDTITSLDIENENIEVLDFSVESGISHKGYTLVNFIVDISVKGSEVEKADELAISWNEQSVEYLKIGEMILKNKEVTDVGGFSPVEAYTVGYPSPSLDIHIQNDYHETVLLEGVRDLNHNLTYSFDSPIEFLPNGSNNVVIAKFHIKNEYDFYTISPIANYTLGNDSKDSHLPGVIFRMLDSDEDKIERMIKNIN
ncbi:MAG: hypothetical protein R6U04_06150 [Bacteroidales bacterium]